MVNIDKIYCLSNDNLDRVYFTKSNHDFDKSNLSKFLRGKLKSIEGYTKQLDFEVLNMNYDTLVFNSRNIDTVECLGEFIRAKEIAIQENKEMITWQTKGLDLLVSKKAFGMYKVKIHYQNLFQIAFNEKMINIKILSVAFYTMPLKEIFTFLNLVTTSLFDIKFHEHFVCARLDYAIDVKYNFNIFENTIKTIDWSKFTKKNLKVYNEPLGRSITYKKNHAQFIIYDKVLEVYKSNNEKKEIYEKIFNIDFNNAFDIQEYINGENYIFRYEYRLDNKDRYLEKNKINIFNIFFNTDYVKCFIGNHIKNKLSFGIPEDNLFRLLLEEVKVELEIENFDETRYLELEIENSIKTLIGYVTGIHSKMMYLDNDLKGNFDGVDDVFKYIKEKLYDYDYFNKVETKYQELINRKYK